MKSFIVIACVFACAYAASVESEAQVVQSVYDLTPEGQFQYLYETENGIQGQAAGVLKATGKDEAALEVTGGSSYISPEGETISITYTANENGYQPQGAHLPTPPPTEPLPTYIARALEYIAAHPYTEEKL